MTTKKETFAGAMHTFAYRYEPRSLFDDFLTMCICAVAHNPVTKKSPDEELYLQTVAKYANDKPCIDFPKLFALLIQEMEDRVGSGQGNDVLGEYFEQHFCRKNSGQFFSPWPICQFMAKAVCGNALLQEAERPQRVIDPACGSGRMLLAGAQDMGPDHEFYGIDIDHTCVKMTALNLFLNGVFHSEVMWGDALLRDDFRMSYRISFLPFGIFRIQDKERSRLWHMHVNSFPEKVDTAAKAPVPVADIRLPSESGGVHGSGLQGTLF